MGFVKKKKKSTTEPTENTEERKKQFSIIDSFCLRVHIITRISV
jgi:hypothetical protein